MSALDKQVGGDHYKRHAIQPVEFIVANNLGYCEANAIKYLCRWESKGGIRDLEKAIHYIELLIEIQTKGLEKLLPHHVDHVPQVVSVSVDSVLPPAPDADE